MKKTNGYYIPALDGLRAFSISFVLIAHLAIIPFPASLGVTVFFFISGFLITNLLLNEYDKTQTINLKDFYIRRFIRLYPPLLVMIIVSIILGIIKAQYVPREAIFASLFYYFNYFHLFSDKGGEVPKLLWSLAVEEHFYLLFPWLLLYMLKKKKNVQLAIIILCILALLRRIHVLYVYGVNDFSQDYNYTATDTRMDSILFGCLSAILLYRKEEHPVYMKAINSLPVFIISCSLIVYTILTDDFFIRSTFLFTIQGVALFFIIPGILYSNKLQFLKRLLSFNPIVYMGKLSYSIYLFHVIVYNVVNTFLIPEKSFWQAIVKITLSFIVAILSYNYIEQPFLRLRKKFGSVVRS